MHGEYPTTGRRTMHRILTAACLVLLVWPAAAAIPTEERQALIDLYISTHGAGWVFDDNWLGPSGTEGEWLGVTVNLNGTHVTGIDLSGVGLTGTLPASIGRFAELQRLNLDDNALEGALPESIGRLKSLRLLSLSRNRLEGRLPASLGDLRRLEQLHLDGNRFQGEVPETFGYLTRLWNAAPST